MARGGLSDEEWAVFAATLCSRETTGRLVQPRKLRSDAEGVRVSLSSITQIMGL